MKKQKFNELEIGTVGYFGVCKFVKIKHAVSGTPINRQLPDVVILDNDHYAVIGADAICEIDKCPSDPEYAPDTSNADLIYDWDRE